MTKVFKIIMNIVLILFIATFCVLFIPSFFGVTTAYVKTGIESNLSVGSVAYGIRESLGELQPGDKIISNSEEALYIYEVYSVDSDNGEVSVQASEESEPEVIEIRRTAIKEIIAVPYLGYVLIAMDSLEGIIVLGLTAVLIIILFIIASILRSRALEDEEEANSDQITDAEYFKGLTQSVGKYSKLDDLKTSMPPITEELPSQDERQTEDFSSAKPLDEEYENIPELILENADASEADAKENTSSELPVAESYNEDAATTVIPPVGADVESGKETEEAADSSSGDEAGSGEGAEYEAMETADLSSCGEVDSVENEKSKSPKEAEEESEAGFDFAKNLKTAAAGTVIAAGISEIIENASEQTEKSDTNESAKSDEPEKAAYEKGAGADESIESSDKKAPEAAEVDDHTADSTEESIEIPDTDESKDSFATEKLDGILAALEEALNSDKVEQTEEAKNAKPTKADTQEEVPSEKKSDPDEIELAIPARNLDDLLQEAYQKGEDPQIKKEPLTGVTFVDYSNCF